VNEWNRRKSNIEQGEGGGGERRRREAERSTRNSPQYFETKNCKQNKTKQNKKQNKSFVVLKSIYPFR
jgi:hypothetical protein